LALSCANETTPSNNDKIIANNVIARFTVFS